MPADIPPATPPEAPARRWGTLTKQIVVFGGIATAVWAMFRFSAIIPPVVIAVLLAYVLTPLVNGLRRLTRMPRGLALVIIYLLLLLVITLTPALILPNLVRQFTALNVDLKGVLETLKTLASQPIDLFGLATIRPADYLDQLVAAIPSVASPFAGGVWGVLVSITSSLAWLIFILVVSLYLVKDSARVGYYLRGLIPPDYRHEALRLLSEIENVWRAFFRGQILLGLIIGVLVGVVTSILGVRNAAMLGLLAGLLEAVPYFGPTIAAIVGILLALVWGSSVFPALDPFWFAVIVAGAYEAINLFENNFALPRVVGRSVNLHPAVVLVGAVAGVFLGGPLGVFLASPVMATLRILSRYAYRKVMDLQPFVEAEEPAETPRGVVAGRPIQALIFDMDGALVSTAAPAGRWAVLMRKLAPAHVTSRFRRALRNRTLDAGEKPVLVLTDAFQRAGLRGEASAIQTRWSRQRSRRNAAASIPARSQAPAGPLADLAAGAEELLENLGNRFKLAVVSRRPRAEVEALLGHWGIADLFDILVAREEVDAGETQRCPLLLAAARLYVQPEQCAVVSAAKEALLEAHGVGAVFVAIADPDRPAEDLADADLMVAKLIDLRSYF